MESSGRDGGRRGSLSRILERVRNSIRRRRGASGRAEAGATSERPATAVMEDVPEQSRVEESRPAVVTTSDLEKDRSTDNIPAPNESQTQTSIAMRESISGTEDQLLPMPSSRSGFSQEKARALFEKYGLTYESLPTSTLKENNRRVERPIRIRIHWVCHECNTQFGANRTCVNCEHRRCSECIRTPEKRVREILGSANVVEEERPSGQGPAGLATALVIEAPESAGSALAIEPTQPVRLEPRSAEEIAEDDPLPAHPLLYVLQQRPSAGVELMFPNIARPAERTCHECQAHIESANRSECQQCRHQICSACPQDLGRRIQWSQAGMGGFTDSREEAKMVPTVQRVYRKPRQRIRWNCHECNTMFVDRTRCRACGHERCKMCPRTP
jgi:hypothetical protein